MCGIAGYVDFASPPPDRAILERMAGALRRRGPDAGGLLAVGPCGLAHRRLSIIDIARSQQPMRPSGSPIAIVYNGELYNYRTLRDELVGQGVQLYSSGDTEVLARYVEREWKGALERFDGMYSFGAWDENKNRLLLARDPLGIKPLFYALPHGKLLVFASEIKALLEHPAVERALDEGVLRQVLRFRAAYGQNCLYRGIRQVPPGGLIEFDQTGLRSATHYDLCQDVHHARERLRCLDEHGIVSLGKELCTSSIRKRLVADVPVGAFLSGGLDSSFIVSTIKDLPNDTERLCTFSVGFRGDRRSELPYAKIMADHIHSYHKEILVTETDYVSSFIDLTRCRDAPLSEPQDIAIAEMSRVAKEHVKVVLSGEGADEVFAGYPKYCFASVPSGVCAVVRALGADRVAGLAGMLGMDRRRALVVARALSAKTESGRIAQWFGNLDRAIWACLLPGLEWSDEAWHDTEKDHSAVASGAMGNSRLQRMQIVDCLTWLPGNLLERGDRMTMAAGLEMRVPFLDTRLVAFGIALDDQLKIRAHRGKWILRHWAQPSLPCAILRRKKCGFHIPLAEWFRGCMRPMLSAYLFAKNSLCSLYGDPRQIRRLLESHWRGACDSHRVLWALLSAEVWYQDVFRPALRPT